MELEGILAIYGYPLKDPAATCRSCGALGTVGRAIRKLDEREIFHSQYCAACWPAESARLRTAWDGEMEAWLADRMAGAEPSPVANIQSAIGAATWDGAEAFVRDHVLPAQRSSAPPSRAVLESIATQYKVFESEFVGEMPPIVAAFVQEYSKPLGRTHGDSAT